MNIKTLFIAFILFCSFNFASGQNNAMSFTAGGEMYVEVPHSASLALNDTFTLEAWASYSGSNRTIVDKASSNHTFQMMTNGFQVYNTASDSKVTSGPTYVSSGVTISSPCSAVDQALTATNTSVSEGSATTITTASSEVGVNYTIYEATGNTVVDGPTAGTGSSLSFTTENLTTTTSFYLTGANPSTDLALDFDNDNDNVSIPSNSSMNGGSAITIEAWIYRRSVGHQTVFSKWDDDSNQRGYMMNFGEGNSPNLSFFATTTGVWSNQLDWNTGLSVPLNEWHHVSITFTESGSNNVKCYYDGALFSQTTWNFSIHSSNIANTIIGGYDSSGNGLNAGANSRMFDGQIDEVRVWNTERSAGDISSNMSTALTGSETGLAAYYNFREGANTTLNDLSSGNNHGTLTNMDPNTDWVTGSGVTEPGCTVTSASYVSVEVTLPPPTITSFTPTSGVVGTSVTITGTDFNTTPANNIVFFGATSAVVIAATATSLTVTVPSGATYAPITVLNTETTLAVYSNTNFIPTFTPNNESITSDDFGDKVDYGTGVTPMDVVLGDIDGDGKPDILTPNQNSHSFSVLLNTSSLNSLSFATKVDFSAGQQAVSIHVADIDGDGKLDVSVLNFIGNSVSVFLNTSTIGAISFDAAIDIDIDGNQPWFVTLSDIDGDGKLDMALGAKGANYFSVFRNTSSIGNISFDVQQDFASFGATNDIGISDLDADGKPDVVIVQYYVSSIHVYKNTSTIGAISFAAASSFATTHGTVGVAIGDLDGDGKLDLAVAILNTNVVNIFKNTSTTGTINFDAKVDIATTQVTGQGDSSSSASGSYGIAIGDLDGNGKPDLALSNYQASYTVSILRNTSSVGSINFDSNIDFPSGDRPRKVAIGDLNGDGKPDLAAASSQSNTVSVFRNIGVPSVTSVTVPINATYIADQNLDFTVNFNKNVTVLTTGGTPQLALTIGNTASQAVYQSGSGTNALVFRYTVQAGDLDADGISIGTLAANNGILRDTGSNNATLTLNSVASTTGVLVDALVPPTITNFNNYTKTYFDGSFSISDPISDSAGAFTYTSDNASVATISGNTVTIIGAGTANITATQAADERYSDGNSIVSLTVNSVSVVDKYGKISSTSVDYINKYGAIGGADGIGLNGEKVLAKSPSLETNGLTADSASTSAYAIKQAYPASTDGLYWIANSNINEGTPFQIYADMTTDGGGWTLIMKNSANAGWTYTNAISLNTTIPYSNTAEVEDASSTVNYSIIGWADYIKKSDSGFQYMIDAKNRGTHGAIWTANGSYSFVKNDNTQTDVTINTKFGTWNYDESSIEQRMPWYSDCDGAITTSAICNTSWWGTLVSLAHYDPAPYIGSNCGDSCSSEPGIIWYWVR